MNTAQKLKDTTWIEGARTKPGHHVPLQCFWIVCLLTTSTPGMVLYMCLGYVEGVGRKDLHQNGLFPSFIVTEILEVQLHRVH